MSDDEPTQSGRSWVSRVVWTLVILFCFLFFLPLFARDQWLLGLPFHLIVGCLLHASRALTHFARDLPGLMTAAIFPCMATIIALCGAHRLILWWRNANGKNSGWHFKHTALSGSLVLLCSAAAIALSGILHEAVWLPQGNIIQSNNRSDLTMAISNARQLGLMLLEHENDHGTYPSSLLELEKLATNSLSFRRMIFVYIDTQGPPEPLVLFKMGGTSSNDPNEIVMIGPQMTGEGDFVILRADCSVNHLSAEKFIEVVRSAKGGKPDRK